MITALGIDPGLAETGYAVLSGGASGVVFRDAGILRTAAEDGLATRLADLHRDVTQVLGEFRCDMVVMEDLYAYGRSPRTAITMGHARGVILLAAAFGSAPVVALPPAAVKRVLVGSGRAGKAQIQRMVERLLALPRPVPDHVADAAALALVGLSRRGVPLILAPAGTSEGQAPAGGSGGALPGRWGGGHPARDGTRRMTGGAMTAGSSTFQAIVFGRAVRGEGAP